MCEKLNEDFDFVVFTFRSITPFAHPKLHLNATHRPRNTTPYIIIAKTCPETPGLHRSKDGLLSQSATLFGLGAAVQSAGCLLTVACFWGARSGNELSPAKWARTSLLLYS